MYIESFTEETQLISDGLKLDPDTKQLVRCPNLTVPGQPLIPLDEEEVSPFLNRELSTKRLDDIYGILWLVSSKQNISPLHHQAIKGRNIIITERPDLHLVWHHNQIFVKPIPRCLLNYAFFKTYISGFPIGLDFQKSANGFLWTYTKLIVHESDFNLAKKLELLPDDEAITWIKWCKFIQGFQHMTDNEVAKRYHYGELRLTRLNFYYRVLFRGWTYLNTYTQYDTYFGRFLAPFLFVFGSISLVLTAMQVALATSAESKSYNIVAYNFSNFTIWAVVTGLAFFPFMYLWFKTSELIYAVTHGQRPTS